MFKQKVDIIIKKSQYFKYFFVLFMFQIIIIIMKRCFNRKRENSTQKLIFIIKSENFCCINRFNENDE